MNLSRLFATIEPQNILLAGDMISDGYTFGSVSRISPEAPVGVMHWTGEQRKPGGVGNVALNIASLGGNVRLLSKIGNDEQGKFLLAELEKKSIDLQYISIDENWPTSFKNRIIASNQQVLRIDQEVSSDLDTQLESKIVNNFDEIFKDIQLFAISDYNKGFLSRSLLKALINEANKRSIPIIIDPKGSDWSKYEGATIIKPNEKECFIAAALPGTPDIDAAAEAIFSSVKIDNLLVTRGSKGISLFSNDKQHLMFKTQAREVIDVTGAGDTVLAALSVCMSSGLSISDSILIANIAAGIAVEALGCHHVSFSEMAHELLDHYPSGLVMDKDHYALCKHYIAEKKIALLSINAGADFESTALNIQSIHQETGAEVALLVDPVDFNNIQLKAYNCIKNVIFLIDQKLVSQSDKETLFKN